MCDFFWPSPPADQGDLSDVVRASLQQLPTVATPGAAAACTHASLGGASHHDLPEKDQNELLLVQGRANRHGEDQDEVHLQQPVGNDMGMMVSSNRSGSCDHLLLQPSPSYPQPEPMQHVMSGPPPQLLGAAGIAEIGECDVAPLEMDEHALDMAMDAHPHAPALKRRKSQTKKVVCIPAAAAPPGVGGRPSTSGEVVPSDLWAWRKYGQKPIKGSPYPRGYYRCSSSKGCSARKQVERSRTDPSMLVITYTSDHNHPWPTQRNALAGSTRLAAASSAAAKGHYSSTPGAVPPPPHRHHTTSIGGDSATSSSVGDNVHHQQVPKQEVLDVIDHPMPEQDAAAGGDHDVDMFADMDSAINIATASNFNDPQKQQQQHATAADDDRHLEQDDKQQLLDPFSFNFLDWVGASFGIGDANNGAYT